MNPQYLISSTLLLTPFIVAAPLTVNGYQTLVEKKGDVVDLAEAVAQAKVTTTAKVIVATGSAAEKGAVFQITSTATGLAGDYFVIGSRNPYVFFSTKKDKTPTGLKDFSETITVVLDFGTGPGSKKDANLFLNGTKNLGKIDYIDTAPPLPPILPNQNILFFYSYLEFLSFGFVAVFGIEILRVLYKRTTLKSIKEGLKKLKVSKGLKVGLEGELEEESQISALTAILTPFNFFGWIASQIFFPRGNNLYALSFIILVILFLISVYQGSNVKKTTDPVTGDQFPPDFPYNDFAAAILGIMVLLLIIF